MTKEKQKIEGYDLPELEEVVIDPSQNKVVDLKDLTPWQMIEVTAKQNNINIKSPNPDCKKCYGRGYKSFTENEITNRDGNVETVRFPVPCSCIFDKETLQADKDKIAVNRKVKRNYEKSHYKGLVDNKNRKMKELNLVQVSKNTYRNKNNKMFSWDDKNFVLIK